MTVVETTGLERTMFLDGCPIILVTPATTGFSVSTTIGFFCINGGVFFCRSGGVLLLVSMVTLLMVARTGGF